MLNRMHKKYIAEQTGLKIELLTNKFICRNINVLMQDMVLLLVGGTCIEEDGNDYLSEDAKIAEEILDILEYYLNIRCFESFVISEQPDWELLANRELYSYRDESGKIFFIKDLK